MFICLATWPLESVRTAGRGTVGVKYSDPYGFPPARGQAKSIDKIMVGFFTEKQKTSDLHKKRVLSTTKGLGADGYRRRLQSEHLSTSGMSGGRGRAKGPNGSEYSTPTVGRVVFVGKNWHDRGCGRDRCGRDRGGRPSRRKMRGG